MASKTQQRTRTVRRPSKARRRTGGRPVVVRHPDTLRTSERTTVNLCRQRWSWGYNQRLRPRREKPALRFGTLIHKALEIHYNPDFRHRKLPPIADIFTRLFDEELEETQQEWDRWRDEDDEWHTYRELGVVMLEGYLDHFANQDQEYVVLAVEQRFETPIWVPPDHPPLQYPSPTKYVGTIDRVLYHLLSKRLLFSDYKTTSTDPTKVGHLALDEQAGAYWAMGPYWIANQAPDKLRRSIQKQIDHLPRAHRQAVERWHFDGILYDFLKKALPDDREVNEEGYALNQNGTVSKRQPGPLFHREPVYRDDGDKQNVLYRVYEDAREIGLMRQGKLAIKKSPSKFACQMAGCQFVDLCELHETQAHGWEGFQNSEFEVWNPYSTYEIEYDELR